MTTNYIRRRDGSGGNGCNSSRSVWVTVSRKTIRQARISIALSFRHTLLRVEHVQCRSSIYHHTHPPSPHLLSYFRPNTASSACHGFRLKEIFRRIRPAAASAYAVCAHGLHVFNLQYLHSNMNQCGPEPHMPQFQRSNVVSDLMILNEW